MLMVQSKACGFNMVNQFGIFILNLKNCPPPLIKPYARPSGREHYLLNYLVIADENVGTGFS